MNFLLQHEKQQQANQQALFSSPDSLVSSLLKSNEILAKEKNQPKHLRKGPKQKSNSSVHESATNSKRQSDMRAISPGNRRSTTGNLGVAAETRPETIKDKVFIKEVPFWIFFCLQNFEKGKLARDFSKFEILIEGAQNSTNQEDSIDDFKRKFTIFLE